MPQPDRRARLDGYAKPLPILADVREQSLVDHPTNQAHRRFLLTLIEESLRRGWYGTVRICCHVEDGILQADFTTGLEREWRAPRE